MKKLCNNEILRILCAIYTLICIMIFFLYLIPCIESASISQMENQLLQRYPPPKGARSFIINSGKIIYYSHASPKDDPVTFLLFSFLLAGSVITSSALTQK